MPRKKKTKHFSSPFVLRWKPEMLSELKAIAAARQTTMAGIVRGLVEREIHKAKAARR